MEHAPATLLSEPSGFWFALVLILLSFTFLAKSLKNRILEKGRKHKLPQGPKPWPIVGSLPEMLASKNAVRWIHNLMSEMKIEIACIRLGSIHVIPVSSPTIAREFLKKQDASFASRPITMATDLVSSGHSTTAFAPFGGQWKKMKKVLSSDLLSPLKLEWLHDKRVEEADHLVHCIYKQCKDPDKAGLVNVRFYAQHYCANVIRKMIFDRRYFGKGQKNGGPGLEDVEHVGAIFTCLRYLYAFCVSDYMPCLRGLDLDGHEKIVKKNVRILKKYQDPIIEDRIQHWKEGAKKDIEDLLDVLISLKDANNKSLLTTEEIKAQVIELMVASVDNPSNAVEWAIAEMLNRRELLQRATDELDAMVGKERLVQESDLPKLNYVKACAREAFRLHPMVAFNVPHVSMVDTTVAGYLIPKGSHVLLSRVGLGRNPHVWSEPLRFKPERHLKSDGSNVVLTEPDLNFISFATGRRGCPGVILGSAMTIMLFARLLHGFTWSVPPNESSIDLSESEDSISLARPLVALAKPRLPAELYVIKKNNGRVGN